jgi:hypothetical protein
MTHEAIVQKVVVAAAAAAVPADKERKRGVVRSGSEVGE